MMPVTQTRYIVEAPHELVTAVRTCALRLAITINQLAERNEDIVLPNFTRVGGGRGGGTALLTSVTLLKMRGGAVALPRRE